MPRREVWPSKGGVAMDYLGLIYLIIVLYLLKEVLRLVRDLIRESNRKR